MKLHYSPTSAFVRKANVPANELGIDQLTAAVSWSYLDLRFADEDWRPQHSGLSAWYAVISHRPSMASAITKTA